MNEWDFAQDVIQRIKNEGKAEYNFNHLTTNLNNLYVEFNENTLHLTGEEWIDVYEELLKSQDLEVEWNPNDMTITYYSKDIK